MLIRRRNEQSLGLKFIQRRLVATAAEALGGEHAALGSLQAYFGAVGIRQRVGHGVEVKPTGKRQRHHHLGRPDEGVGIGVAVGAASEITVE